MIKDLIRRHKQKKQEIHNSITRNLQNHVEALGVVQVDNHLMDVVGAGRKILFRAAYELAIRERLAIVADREGQILLMTNSRYRDRLFTRSGLHRAEAAEAAEAAETAGAAGAADSFGFVAGRDEYAPVAGQAVRAEDRFAVADAAPADAFDTLLQDDVLAVTEDTVPIDTVGVEMVDALADDDRSAAVTETLVRHSADAPSASGDAVAADETAAAAVDAETDLDWFAIEVKDAPSWQEVLADYRQSLPVRKRDPWPAKKEAGVDLGFFGEK
ncbi:MAG: hypothetical protein LIQ30_10630 [Planctomycetes bacterium]|nr:hypothetical protein [Planctomycetota bacterium]MCD7897711.1 hypothetical protein [Planctomycetaceae bacterium]